MAMGSSSRVSLACGAEIVSARPPCAVSNGAVDCLFGSSLAGWLTQAVCLVRLISSILRSATCLNADMSLFWLVTPFTLFSMFKSVN